MQFVILANDRPGALELRLKCRPSHLEYLNSLGSAVLSAGPFLDAEGQSNGSMIIVEAADLSAAQAMADNDPFARAGLFADVQVRPWRWTMGKPGAQG
jgi:uncharacterized protein